MAYSEAVKTEAVSRVRCGESRIEVAASMGVDASSIQNWLNERGIEGRRGLRGGFMVGDMGRELLVCSVIEQAFRDVRGEATLPMSAVDWETARAFFEDEEGLDVLCDLAGLDLPRNKLKAMAKRGKTEGEE